ncbi:HdeA/HdeB family chaperone [Paracidovorax wautersii]|uniref:HdeA/HdeB family protein n=1 Tax=Paracidovorax wautersii TaxID=1177982 RepID=A0A1I2AUT3_9BURK|nr:HdeA/HdeB family chaperone [Paracidovorax wautersii]SFE47744.1 HdeA/HdeB family protein [Paracidovorax wautersii]
MRVLPYITALALTAVTATAALAQTPAPAAAPAKPIVKTTCADYIALSETVKPKFIYYAVGHSKKGNKEAVFEEESIDKIKPQLDEFCAVNLTKSAYEKVIASSMATDPANAAHHAHPAKHAK